LLGVILLLFIAVVVYIRSGRLDLFLQSQVTESLTDFGIRAEIGNTHLNLRGNTVSLRDLKLFAGDAAQPFALVKQLTAEFSVLSYLRRQIKIVRIAIDEPQVWVKIDEQGRSNLDALHAPPPTPEEKKSGVTLLSARFEVNHGEVHYDSLRDRISAAIP